MGPHKSLNTYYGLPANGTNNHRFSENDTAAYKANPDLEQVAGDWAQHLSTTSGPREDEEPNHDLAIFNTDSQIIKTHPKKSLLSRILQYIYKK